MTTEPVVDEVKALRDAFHGKDAAIISTEIQQKSTLGLGHFSRVRLIDSSAARDELKTKYDIDHSGTFALKVMKKSEILRLKQEKNVKEEQRLLFHLKNPFLVVPYHKYQDERNICLLMEYIPGGEIGSKLKNEETFSNELSRFYIAQLVMVLQYLHTENVIYRSVGITDIMIDRQGYIKLVDFGNAKFLPPKEDEPALTYTLCGVPEYIAPEVISTKGHGKGADWWAVGILIFEFLAGYPPFYADEPTGIYTEIMNGFEKKYGPSQNGLKPMPKSFDEHASNLIKKLLNNDVKNRLGSSSSGAEDIKRHKWFRGLDWAKMYNKQLKPPYEPALADDYDTSYFGNYEDSVEESGPLLPPADMERFDYWSN